MGKRETRLFWQISQIRWFKKIIKGSPKDPFIYLGLTAAALFYLIPFAASPSNGLPSNKAQILSLSQDAVSPVNDNLALASQNRRMPESAELLMVTGSSIRSASPPVTVSGQIFGTLAGYESIDYRQEITEYSVEADDTVSLIAEKFGISLNTLLWANDLTSLARVKAGQTLIIPPVSGVIHHVKQGDTVSDIALRYKADAQDIVGFNNLAGEGDIYVGDILIVPNGVMSASVKGYAAPSLPIANSYFICPISGSCQITQGLHWYNAIDFSNGRCGGPVYAAAAGKVLRVKLTSSTSINAFGGAGNTVSVLHPNGVVTSYGHIQTSLVQSGQQVSQGQAIALVGGEPGTPGAGRSTGCHVHFGVTGSRNPFAR